MSAREVIHIIAAVAMLLGVGLTLAALHYRKNNAPLIGSMHPRDWFSGGWWGSGHFEAPGKQMNLAGWALFSVATAVFVFSFPN